MSFSFTVGQEVIAIAVTGLVVFAQRSIKCHGYSSLKRLCKKTNA